MPTKTMFASDLSAGMHFELAGMVYTISAVEHVKNDVDEKFVHIKFSMYGFDRDAESLLVILEKRMFQTIE